MLSSPCDCTFPLLHRCPHQPDTTPEGPVVAAHTLSEPRSPKPTSDSLDAPKPPSSASGTSDDHDDHKALVPDRARPSGGMAAHEAHAHPHAQAHAQAQAQAYAQAQAHPHAHTHAHAHAHAHAHTPVDDSPTPRRPPAGPLAAVLDEDHRHEDSQHIVEERPARSLTRRTSLLMEQIQFQVQDD